jgi:pimeloyl-ACP methyl ester carboxylesterase
MLKINKEDREYLENVFKGCWKIIKLNEIDTFVVDRGSGENIIFLNGILAWSFTWRKLLDLMPESYHLYALDYSGTGYSEKEQNKNSMDAFTEQVALLMEYFSMKSTVIVGNSLGGEVALNLAIKYPEKVKALILIDTAGYQKNKEITKGLVSLSRFKLTEYILSLLNNEVTARKLIEGALYDETIVDSDMIKGYLKPLKIDGALEAFFDLVKSLDSDEFGYDKVKSIKKPTLIIWGEYDKIIPVEDAHRLNRDIENSKLVVFNRCGHAPQEEMPEKVVKTIDEFLKKLSNK